MIIDASPVSVTLKRASRNGHPDIIQYSVVYFRLNSDYSNLCNRDNDVSKMGNTDFPPLVGEYMTKPFKMFACDLYKRLV